MWGGRLFTKCVVAATIAFQLMWGVSTEGHSTVKYPKSGHCFNNDRRIRFMILAGDAVNGLVPTVIRNSSVPRLTEEVVASLVEEFAG